MARRRPQTESNGDHHAMPAPADDPAPQHSSHESSSSSESDVNAPGNQPAHVVRFGPVRACVWRNHDSDRTWYQVTVNRLYKGQDDCWHTTDAFGYNHLLPLMKALDWAHSWIAAQLANSDVPF